MTKRERYEKVLAWFKQNMGKVETELHYRFFRICNPKGLNISICNALKI
jgi:hypothetical protein